MVRLQKPLDTLIILGSLAFLVFWMNVRFNWIYSHLDAIAHELQIIKMEICT